MLQIAKLFRCEILRDESIRMPRVLLQVSLPSPFMRSIKIEKQLTPTHFAKETNRHAAASICMNFYQFPSFMKASSYQPELAKHQQKALHIDFQLKL